MTRPSECLITGCELYVPSEEWWAHGDLYRISSVYIFNAVMYRGETLKHYTWNPNDPPLPKHGRMLTLDTDAAYFECRGVIVVGILDAELNDEAKRYLGMEPSR